MKKINTILIMLAVTIVTANAQSSMRRPIFSGGGGTKSLVPVTFGQPLAGNSFGTRCAGLLMGAQPGDDTLLSQTLPACLGVGIEKPRVDESVKIYPNPANDYVMIDFSVENNNCVVTMMDIEGRVIKQIKNVKGNQLKLDVSELVKGVYILNITNENKKVLRNEKIVLQ